MDPRNGGHDEAGNDTHHGVGGSDEHVQGGHQAVGDKSGDRHEHEYVQRAHHQHGDQGGDDEVQHIRHVLAHKLLHLGQNPHADDYANDAAFSGGEHRGQGLLGVI